MKIILLGMALFSNYLNAQIASKVDFEAYENLMKEVKIYRKDRLINFDNFLKFSKQKHTVILDTRSKEMYTRKHIKGAINLNFSDFTQENLAKIFDSADIRILIYCNNNIDNEPVDFPTKMVSPKAKIFQKQEPKKEITLALNIPTFINLYGYGYKNVYELSEFISAFDSRIEFEGTNVSKNNTIFKKINNN